MNTDSQFSLPILAHASVGAPTLAMSWFHALARRSGCALIALNSEIATSVEDKNPTIATFMDTTVRPFVPSGRYDLSSLRHV
jgi:hypothetical protein